MLGILAVIFLALSFFVHGFGFHPSAWIDWASLLTLGLTFLALHLLGVGAGVSVFHRTTTTTTAPPQ